MQKHFLKLLIVFQLVTVSNLFSQNIAINATGTLPDTSAMLDISSSNKGFLMPRLTTSQMNSIPLPATGLIIFNISINMFEVNVGTPASPSWETLSTSVGNWLTGGNAGTNSGSKFLGTTDSVSLRFKTNNIQRMVLDSLGNVAIGTSPSFTSSPNANKFLVDAGTTTSYNVITAKGNVNNYLQFNVQNQSSGASASSDLVATADNGTETNNYVNMGINGSGYTGGVMGSANDAYLFNVGNNLLIGTGTAAKSLVFMTGGTTQSSNERMRIDGTGNMGVGTTSPGSKLDVKGTLRLSGSTSGYVGLAPAAAAGSTTYTLPSADGTNGQALTTNGSGTLTWVSPSVTTTHTLSSSGNVVTSIVNGVSATANAVNTVSNNSSVNTLTTTVNGVAGTGVNIINTNASSLSGTNLTTTINGVASSALNLSSLDSSIYKTNGTLWANRTVTMGANNLTFSSTTGNIIFNPSSTGKIGIGTTTPNYPLHIHDATVNPSGGTWMQISNNASGSGTYDGFYYGVNAAGSPEVWAKGNLDIVTGSGTTNNYTMRLTPTGYVGIGTLTPASSLDVKGTLHLSGSTSGYVGFAPAAAAGSTTYTLPTADGTSGQQLTTNGTGVLSWTSAGGTTTHTLSSSANVITSIVNGVSATANAVNTVANSSSVNTLTTTINGVAGTGVNIINSHTISLAGTSITSTVNGVASSALNLASIDSSIYKTDGTLWGARTVTIGANNLTFGSTTGNLIFNPSSTGKLGIGTTTPGSSLDVKGTLRLSGSTSGYVGFAPAAAAGSTTYTLPSADGTNGQQLTTNGTGTLSWTTSGNNTASNGITMNASDIELGGNLTQATTITNNGNALNITGSALTSTFASTGYFGIGTTSPSKALHVVMNSSGTNVATFENSNAAGFSSMDWLDNTGALSFTFGYANASVGGIFSGKAYMNSYGHDFVLTSNSTLYNININGSTGNVGINNSAPGSTLDVKGTLRLSGSTSGYVGFAPAAAAGSTTYTLPSADGANGQQLTTNGSGTLSWTSSNANTTNTLSSSSNTITSTVNGVAATANAINSNSLSLNGTSITSTVNGVASSALDLSDIDNNLYNSDGTLGGSRTVTLNANNLTFSSTTGNVIFNQSSTGEVGIGTTTPKSLLDIDGAFGTTISTQSGSSAITLDNTAAVWYFTGTANVTLPTASTCKSRRYVIVNRKTSARTISSFTSLAGAATTSIAASSSIEIISDGTSWLQIR